MDASTLISGQSAADTVPVAQTADLAASLAAAVAAFQEACAQFTAGVAEISAHARVLAEKDAVGHFKMGMGFEYDPVTGTHNVNGTAEYKADLAAALAALGNELRTSDATLESALAAVQAALKNKADADALTRMTWVGPRPA